jgi:hypothetical protein
MELNKQRNTMNVMSQAAKLGNAAQTKVESLAQSQMLKTQQYTMYSANFGGMHGIGSGGMQVPQISMIGMMGDGGFNPFNQGMIANQMNGCGGLGMFVYFTFSFKMMPSKYSIYYEKLFNSSSS